MPASQLSTPAPAALIKILEGGGVWWWWFFFFECVVVFFLVRWWVLPRVFLLHFSSRKQANRESLFFVLLFGVRGSSYLESSH